MEQYTGFSAHASLALIAEWTKSNCIWEELSAQVHIRQKTIKHSPCEKLKDLLINMWAGGERVSSINNLRLAKRSMRPRLKTSVRWKDL